MVDPKNSQGDEHIEDLLSQLQGIFGKLSRSEEEESERTVELPKTTQPPPPAKPPVAPREPPREPPAVLSDPLFTPSAAFSEPALPSAEEIAAAQDPLTALPAPPSEEGIPPAPSEDAKLFSSENNATAEPTTEVAPPAAPLIELPPSVPYQSTVEPTEGCVRVSTALFYPLGRESEAKALAEKLETMTPKFTKVTFQLQMSLFMAYDPKTDWKEAVMQKVTSQSTRAMFLVIERPIEDSRRRAIISDLTSKNIYFQEVPLLSIEKKAFYIDLLLGLVFFFDSMKKPGSPGA
jgi:hypothetical protein